MTSQMGCFAFLLFFFFFFFLLALDLVLCVRACVCRAAIFNMATILKLVCVKGLRGYARFAVLFVIYFWICCCSFFQLLLQYFPLVFFLALEFQLPSMQPLLLHLLLGLLLAVE